MLPTKKFVLSEDNSNSFARTDPNYCLLQIRFIVRKSTQLILITVCLFTAHLNVPLQVIVAAELLKNADELVKCKIHPTSIISGYRLACKYVLQG